VLKVSRLLERRVVPVEVLGVTVQVRVVVADRAEVAAEVEDVDGVEADLFVSGGESVALREAG
jgi:hypothetical protein